MVIAEAGLDPALFESTENTIPFVDLGRFVKLCVRHSGCAHLGLLVGETMGTDVLGLVGRLAASAADVRTALKSIVEYLHLHDRGALPTVWVRGERAAIAYVIHESEVLVTEQVYGAAMANAYNILKSLAGPLWAPTEVRFSRSRPAVLEPYRRFFRARLRFEADENAVVFPSYWLDAPVTTADAASRQAHLDQAQTLVQQEAGNVVVLLRRLLRRLLIQGANEGKIDLETVAGMSAVHRRTLNRRLRAEGTRFRSSDAGAHIRKVLLQTWTQVMAKRSVSTSGPPTARGIPAKQCVAACGSLGAATGWLNAAQCAVSVPVQNRPAALIRKAHRCIRGNGPGLSAHPSTHIRGMRQSYRYVSGVSQRRPHYHRIR